ncbi:hypothetical protein THASP1DRAFT_24807 [Thamnocephalis sphaerospora]|uniref:Transmembrane protein n=1 Tax=Thamnocephalis sphaerospora TaxID=78915 RepID=A0A4P9XM85_9FUNG|nr:hypothetical protein THASP1DRAFT_24807 [Thamnocephalis sphaerospora]|eukprot:RKP06956.1 hypothetical protein THASP1DRAFT_24807 [Thamnocephalis sphaerospora]
MRYAVQSPFSPECNWMVNVHDCDIASVHIASTWITFVENCLLGAFGTWLLWRRRRRMYGGQVYEQWRQSLLGRWTNSCKKEEVHSADMMHNIDMIKDSFQEEMSDTRDLGRGIASHYEHEHDPEGRITKERRERQERRWQEEQAPQKSLRTTHVGAINSRGIRFTGRPVDSLLLMFTLCMYTRGIFNLVTVLDVLPTFSARQLFFDATFWFAFWAMSSYLLVPEDAICTESGYFFLHYAVANVLIEPAAQQPTVVAKMAEVCYAISADATATHTLTLSAHAGADGADDAQHTTAVHVASVGQGHILSGVWMPPPQISVVLTLILSASPVITGGMSYMAGHFVDEGDWREYQKYIHLYWSIWAITLCILCILSGCYLGSLSLVIYRYHHAMQWQYGGAGENHKYAYTADRRTLYGDLSRTDARTVHHLLRLFLHTFFVFFSATCICLFTAFANNWLFKTRSMSIIVELSMHSLWFPVLMFFVFLNIRQHEQENERHAGSWLFACWKFPSSGLTANSADNIVEVNNNHGVSRKSSGTVCGSPMRPRSSSTGETVRAPESDAEAEVADESFYPDQTLQSFEINKGRASGVSKSGSFSRSRANTARSARTGSLLGVNVFLENRTGETTLTVP